MKPSVTLPLLAALLVACTSASRHRAAQPICHEPAIEVDAAPGVRPELRRAESWLGQLTEAEAAKVLLSSTQIQALNARNLASNQAAYQDVLDPAIALPERVEAELAERIAWLDTKLKTDTYREALEGTYEGAKARIASATARDRLHIVAGEADIRCIPMDEGLFTEPADEAFDRNRCSRLHVGEVIRVLREADAGAWLYIHAGHSVGWLHRPQLSPPVEPTSTRAYLGVEAHAVVTDDLVAEDVPLRMGRRFPARRGPQGSWQLEVPTTTGFRTLTLPANAPVHLGAVPMTRSNLWRLAMARLDEPYGWGGYLGGRDCSRLLMDLFSVFGLRFGRHSSVQAHAGTATIDLKPMSPLEKREALRAAAAEGVALVYMPGHIMLHLGEVDGRPYALSSISEFVSPCAEGDQVLRIDRVTVSDYELGRDTKRTSFLERISTLAVFGGP
jgi:hypothetical protein